MAITKSRKYSKYYTVAKFMQWKTVKLLHTLCMLSPIPGVNHSVTDEVIYSVQNLILSFYIASHVSRQMLLLLPITALISFSYDSAFSIVYDILFFISMAVPQSSKEHY